MSRRKKSPRKYGEYPIGYEMKRNGGIKGVIWFTLAEKLDNAVSARVAQFEYQCMGHYCHRVPVQHEGVWNVWISNRTGRRKPQLLKGEVVTRRKGSVPRMRKIA